MATDIKVDVVAQLLELASKAVTRGPKGGLDGYQFGQGYQQGLEIAARIVCESEGTHGVETVKAEYGSYRRCVRCEGSVLD